MRKFALIGPPATLRRSRTQLCVKLEAAIRAFLRGAPSNLCLDDFVLADSIAVKSDGPAVGRAPELSGEPIVVRSIPIDDVFNCPRKRTGGRVRGSYFIGYEVMQRGPK